MDDRVHAAQSVGDRFDVVLAGGRAMDPESGLDATRWIGVRDGRIAAVSETPLQGVTEVDARGHVVAPGFIDLHVHGQEPRSYDLLAQDGVTTALELEAGVRDLEGFLARRRGRARVHHGASAGHIPARAFVLDGVGVEHFLTARVMEGGPGLWWLGLRLALGFSPSYADASADDDEQRRIVEALRAELDAGAIGLGLGLAYTPGADDTEIRAVFALAAARGVPAFVHLPSQADRSDLAPLQRVLALTAEAGAALHVVHVNSSGGASVRAYLAAIEAARAAGRDVTVEAYPYTASSTLIESAIFAPGWRARSGRDYGDLQWAATGERLTEQSFQRYREQGGTVILHGMDPEDVAAAIAHPLVMIASDGMPMFEGQPHPRGAGGRARVLTHYVRERGDLTLMDALRKMTLAPARRLEGFVPAMQRKGRLRVGADADLVVFDPETVQDRATFEEPLQGSDGIPHVLVSGEFVVRDGELVDAAMPGQGLRAQSP